jgi:hypothetical protein
MSRNRDASPDRCRLEDHKPTGRWKINKPRGHIRKSGQKFYVTFTAKEHNKSFSIRDYLSEDDAKHDAQKYQKWVTRHYELGINTWRPMTPNHVEIRLTQGKTTILEKEIWEEVRHGKNSFYANFLGNEWYCMRSDSKGLHAIINKTPEGMVTHHLDRKPHHNCRGNLRTADHSMNGKSSNKSKANVSGTTGVHAIRYWKVGRKNVRKLFKIPLAARPLEIPKNVLDANKALYGDNYPSNNITGIRGIYLEMYWLVHCHDRDEQYQKRFPLSLEDDPENPPQHVLDCNETVRQKQNNFNGLDP